MIEEAGGREKERKSWLKTNKHVAVARQRLRPRDEHGRCFKGRIDFDGVATARYLIIAR